MRYAARKDDNKDAIVAALRGAGLRVYDLQRPVDLLVGLGDRIVLVEIKDGAKSPSRRKYTGSQIRFLAQRWPVKTLYSTEDALALARELEQA